MRAWHTSRVNSNSSAHPSNLLLLFTTPCPCNCFPKPLFKIQDQNTATTLSDNEEEERETMTYKTRNESGVSVPKQRGLLQMCFTNFRVGRLEGGRRQKERKDWTNRRGSF